MADALLKAEGVSVRFGGVLAVDDASIDADRGHVFGLIGPNGAGKTTLFNVLCGFTSSEHGRVLLDGADVTAWLPEKRALHGLGRTFQRLELFATMTVLENCVVAHEARSSALTVFDDVLSLRTSRRAAREAKARAMEVLEEVGLAWAAERVSGELPIGLGRVLEVARVLCGSPAALLLDEPSSGLDARETGELGDLLARLAEERNLGVLLVEHDVGLVTRICERVTVMDAGRVIAEGSPEQIRHDPAVIQAYLGEAVA